MKRPLALVLLLGGCSAMPWWDDLSRGDALSTAGRYREAATAYREVVEGAGSSDRRARALFELGRLASDAGNPDRDLQHTTDYFARLRREYPASPWARYAAGWSETLARLARTEQEAARIERELGSLRQQIEATSAELRRGRDAGREAERLRQRLADAQREAAGLRADLDRLKSLELELERRRQRR
jgi:tetratricopeptide (TPR) repeat protein